MSTRPSCVNTALVGFSLFIVPLLSSTRAPGGDQPDLPAAHRVRDVHEHVLARAKNDVPGFAVIPALVLKRERLAVREPRQDVLEGASRPVR
jgi:hypothetical protein